MLTAFRNAFRIHDLRNKILFTLFIFVLYRLGTTIPVPGVDLGAIKEFTDRAADSGFVGLLNLFSGGALTRMSVFALGIMPYITASIILQLLAVVIPKLQALQEEGETGQKVITQWTRYLTVILALLQSTGFSFLFHSGQLTGGIDLIPDYTPRNVIIIVMTMTAGTALLMWFGELITQRGVGNGMFLSSRTPHHVRSRNRQIQQAIRFGAGTEARNLNRKWQFEDQQANQLRDLFNAARKRGDFPKARRWALELIQQHPANDASVGLIIPIKIESEQNTYIVTDSGKKVALPVWVEVKPFGSKKVILEREGRQTEFVISTEGPEAVWLPAP